MSRHRLAIALAAASAVVFLGAAGIALGGTTSGDVGVTAGTAGCGKAPSLNSGPHTISSGGQNRSYILRVPSNYDNNRQYRLFVGLHWLGGTANDVDSGGSDGYNWSYYGLRKLADGSVQGLTELPEELRVIYRTAWELPMRALIDLAAERGAFVDQSQSLNLFMESPNIGALSSMYMYAWKRGIKTTYYLRSRPATKIAKTTVDSTAAVVCSLENPESCEACQ